MPRPVLLTVAQPAPAARLTQPPLDYHDRRPCTGYLPAGTWGGGVAADPPNTSRRRRGLADLVADAAHRQAAEATAATGTGAR